MTISTQIAPTAVGQYAPRPATDAPRAARPAGDAGRTSPGAIVLIALQVAIVAYLVHWFRIEGTPFSDRLVPLAAIGFLPHHFLPARHRMTAFLALSLGGAALLFGMTALWLVGIVCVVIAACRLPIPFRARVALVAAIGVTLALMRQGTLPTPWPVAVWPIAASILMFRTIAYLYDLKHGAAPTGAVATLAYFFLLPNVAFTLFPVVDASAFRRTYYDRPALGIYREGVLWLLRGVLQLVLYRLVYQYVSIAPADVTDTASLVRYLLGNFGLYLRVSGTFHVAVGLLHLYGFRLPETHRLFYLSNGFTDFWRRINIYWKDFMQKVVFAPTFYPLSRRIGPTHALTVATLAVFVATWFFHAYQWFWILGRWAFSVTDTLFWGILAVILVVNSHREMRRGRKRAVRRDAPSGDAAGTKRPSGVVLREMATLGLGTAATFSVICLLWALWNSETLPDFVALLRVARFGLTDVALLLAAPAAIAVAAVGFDRLQPRYERYTASRPALRVAIAAAPLVALAVVSQPRIAGAIGPKAHRVALAMRSTSLNRADAKELQRGYYEQLTDLRSTNGDLWKLYAQRPANWATIDKAGGRRSVRTFVMRELIPGAHVFQKGAWMTINHDGMRDRDYSVAKPAGTWRIALMGKSHVLGEGVPDDSTFEAILERRLNAALPAGAPRIEILNFAVSGFTPLQQAATLDGDRVRKYAPDVVLLVGHQTDTQPHIHLAQLGDSIAIPYDTLRALVSAAGVPRGATQQTRARLLAKYHGVLTEWAYGHVADAARAMGARPAWVYVPLLLETPDAVPELTADARRAGFAVLDIPEMFLGYDENDLALAPWDNHPNAAANRVIADRLLAELLRRPELLGRSLTAATPSATPRSTP